MLGRGEINEWIGQQMLEEAGLQWSLCQSSGLYLSDFETGQVSQRSGTPTGEKAVPRACIVDYDYAISWAGFARYRNGWSQEQYDGFIAEAEAEKAACILRGGR